jgi:DNA-binding MarR family transcriptional regulator
MTVPYALRVHPEHNDGVSPAALDRVTWALRRAEIAVMALKAQRLRPLGMATSHFSLLILVHTYPGLTGAEVARRLGVTPQAVASLVTRLENGGQIERRDHPRHRHVQELHLTDSGREALRAADTAVRQVEECLIAELGPHEASQLRALLDRVTDALSQAGGSSAAQP